MSYHVCKKLMRRPKGKVIRDDLITLKTAKSKKQYPQKLRRVEMLVEVDGKEVAMVFITNHLDWAAWDSLCVFSPVSPASLIIWFDPPRFSERPSKDFGPSLSICAILLSLLVMRSYGHHSGGRATTIWPRG